MNVGVTGYADDTTVHVKEKNLECLTPKLEMIGNNMIQYCNENELVINTKKTQILTSAKQEIKVKVGQDIVASSKTISLLGLEYDENFSTTPYLKKLACEASTRAALIKRLSYGMPYLSGILTDIDKSIRATARTITQTKLKDKTRNEIVLWKAGLRSLTQAVSETMACSIWKALNEKNPLGLIYQNSVPTIYTRSSNDSKLCLPIPGHPEAASNKLAQAWNLMNLSSAKTLGSARALARIWYTQNSTLIQRNFFLVIFFSFCYICLFILTHSYVCYLFNFTTDVTTNR